MGEARNALLEMEDAFGLLERDVSGREEHWTLLPGVRAALARVRETGDGMRSWRDIKDELLQEMRARAVRGEEPLANAVVRGMTHLDRQQVNRLIHELVEEGGVPNRGPWPRCAIRVRGSAGWWGVTEMYALYIYRYIRGRNVSRNVFP